MKNLITSIMFFAIFLCACDPTVTDTQEKNVKNAYIIELLASQTNYTQSTQDGTYLHIMHDYDIDSSDVLFVYKNVIRGFAANLTYEQFQKLQYDNRVSQIEKDNIMVSTDMVLSSDFSSWGLFSVGGSTDATIDNGVASVRYVANDYDTSPDKIAIK